MFDAFTPFLDGLPGLRGVLAFVLLFFLPGFAWTLVFFSKVKLVERLVLSAGLSIALVTISVIALNVFFGVKINGTNALLTVIVLVVVPLAVYYLKHLYGSRSPEQD